MERDSVGKLSSVPSVVIATLLCEFLQEYYLLSTKQAPIGEIKRKRETGRQENQTQTLSLYQVHRLLIVK